MWEGISVCLPQYKVTVINKNKQDYYSSKPVSTQRIYLTSLRKGAMRMFLFTTSTLSYTQHTCYLVAY